MSSSLRKQISSFNYDRPQRRLVSGAGKRLANCDMKKLRLSHSALALKNASARHGNQHRCYSTYNRMFEKSPMISQLFCSHTLSVSTPDINSCSAVSLSKKSSEAEM